MRRTCFWLTLADRLCACAPWLSWLCAWAVLCVELPLAGWPVALVMLSLTPGEPVGYFCATAVPTPHSNTNAMAAHRGKTFMADLLL
jgi:hypothetical protein